MLESTQILKKYFSHLLSYVFLQVELKRHYGAYECSHVRILSKPYLYVCIKAVCLLNGFSSAVNLILIRKSLNLVELYTKKDNVGSVGSSNGGLLLGHWPSLVTWHNPFSILLLLIWLKYQLCHDMQATDIER